MQNLLRASIPTVLGMLTICTISGCADDDLTGKIDEPVQTNLVATIPENEGIISGTGELKMFFDNSPKSVTVDGKRAIVQGNTATVKIANLPDVKIGSRKTVIVEWSNSDGAIVESDTISLTVVERTARRATAIVVHPPPGSLVDEQATEFTLWFNAEVASVTVSGTPATGSGFMWQVWPILPLGPGEMINIEWKNADGSTGLESLGPYTVAVIGFAEPWLTRGTVAYGETDVDPAPINADGFRYDFDRPVRGTIKLTDKAGVDLNWIGNVSGHTATLTPVAGRELDNDASYKIQIDGYSDRGVPFIEFIFFATKSK